MIPFPKRWVKSQVTGIVSGNRYPISNFASIGGGQLRLIRHPHFVIEPAPWQQVRTAVCAAPRWAGWPSVPTRYIKHMMVVADLASCDAGAIEDALEAAWQLQRSVR